MIRSLFSIIVSVFMAIVALGLLVALFAIGLVVLWYFLIIIAVVWAARKVYYFFKGTPPPSMTQQYTQYSSRYREQFEKKSKGRVIEPDE